MTWTKEKPKVEGFYWVWQPSEIWPCQGCVLICEVEKTPFWSYKSLGKTNGYELRGWVPYMGYSDSLTENTWDDAMWMGPIEIPDVPE